MQPAGVLNNINLVPMGKLSNAHFLIAALAEAWHVDGLYYHAAVSWGRIYKEYPSFQVALKVASAWSSMAHHAEAERWLSCAREEFTPDTIPSNEELYYTIGLAKWAAADVPASIEALQYAASLDSSRGRSLNFLGIIEARHGDLKKAIECWQQAIERENGHYDSLVNLALATGENDAEVLDRLSTAVVSAIHRPEAFAVFKRRYQRSSSENSMAIAQQKIDLRRRWLNPIPISLPYRPSELTIHVTGNLHPGTARLDVTFTTMSPGREAVDFLLSPTWQVTIDSTVIEPVEIDCTEWGLHRFQLPILPTGRTSILQLHGALEGTGIHLSSRRIECDGRSGWLPRPHSSAHWIWKIEVQLPSALRSEISTAFGPTDAPSILALPQTSWINLKDRTPGPYANQAQPDVQSTVRVLYRWAERAVDAWTSQLGQCELPRIGIVDVSGLFNYTRSSYVRITSGLLKRPDQFPQICHEIGHIWWGAKAQFVAEDEWLGESLAEFTMHLMQSCDLLTDYRAAAINACSNTKLVGFAGLGLRELAASRGSEAAYVLRVKGGYVISMLAAIMGPEKFRLFLNQVLESAQLYPLRAYDFFALASWIHGCSLAWFANQWVYSNYFPILTAEVLNHTGMRTSLLIRNESAITFGLPIEIHFVGHSGEIEIIERNIDIGEAVIEIKPPWRPQKVIFDPHRRLWAKAIESITL
ncbi:hypothetical protein ACWEKT_31175 [Nocardia takedensis]